MLWISQVLHTYYQWGFECLCWAPPEWARTIPGPAVSHKPDQGQGQTEICVWAERGDKTPEAQEAEVHHCTAQPRQDPVHWYVHDVVSSSEWIMVLVFNLDTTAGTPNPLVQPKCSYRELSQFWRITCCVGIEYLHLIIHCFHTLWKKTLTQGGRDWNVERERLIVS